MSDSGSGGHQPNWYPDPMGRHEYRWFDGTTWTEVGGRETVYFGGVSEVAFEFDIDGYDAALAAFRSAAFDLVLLGYVLGPGDGEQVVVLGPAALARRRGRPAGRRLER